MRFINKYMNSYRIIKLLYTFFIASFMFALEISIVSPLFKLSLSGKDLIILIVLGMLIQVLSSKDISPNKYMPIIFFISFIYSYFFYKLNRTDNYMALIFIFLSVYLLVYVSLDENAIYYEYYRRLGIKTSIILVSLIVSYMFLESHDKNILGKVYIIYIISYISLLRTSRKVFFNVYNIKDEKFNLGLLLGSMVIFLPWTNRVLKVLKVIYESVMGPIIILITNVLYYLIVYPMSKIVNRENIKTFDMGASGNANEFETIYKNGLYHKEFVILGYIIYVIIIVIFLYIAIKILKRMGKKNPYKDEFIEEREKIYKDNTKKKIFNIYKSTFNKDNREKVFYYYGKFLKKAKNKELYKPHMTARQVYGKVRGEIKDKDKDKELLELKDIYNKAKFSSDEVTIEMSERIERAYKSVEKPLN